MIPVPLFDPTLPFEFAERAREASNRRHWEQRENKPLRGCQTRNGTETSGADICPANSLFSGLPVISSSTATGPATHLDENASQHRYPRRVGSAVLLRCALPAATNLR